MQRRPGGLTQIARTSTVTQATMVTPNQLETTWNGLEVCGYGPTQGGSDVAVTFPGGHGEYEWECVELVKRYLYMAYGAQAIDAYGYNLVNNYASTYSSLFTKLANNGTNHIKVGDVLSYDEAVSGDHGHTAIVKSLSLDGSGTGTITVIEENTDTSDQHTETIANWVIKHGIDDGGSTDRVSYWLTPNQSWSDNTQSGTSSDNFNAVSATSIQHLIRSKIIKIMVSITILRKDKHAIRHFKRTSTMASFT